MRVELPPPQLRDPRHRAVRHDNLLDAVDPSSYCEIDPRLVETIDRYVGLHAHRTHAARNVDKQTTPTLV